jgi:hypothetical protein
MALVLDILASCKASLSTSGKSAAANGFEYADKGRKICIVAGQRMTVARFPETHTKPGEGLQVIRDQVKLDPSGAQGSPDKEPPLYDAQRHLDEAILSLKEDIVTYKERIATVEKQLAYLTRVRADLSGLIPSTEKPAQIPEGFGERKRVRKKSLAWTVRRESYIILRQAGTPLNRSEILRELQNRGIEVESADPAKAVGKILWKAAEFEHRDGGYWIKDGSSDDHTSDATK